MPLLYEHVLFSIFVVALWEDTPPSRGARKKARANPIVTLRRHWADERDVRVEAPGSAADVGSGGGGGGERTLILHTG